MNAWAELVREHIRRWSAALPDREWWPRYVFHFTDLHNAVSILRGGAVHSRAKASELGLLRTDAASQAVIAQTTPAHLQYVRLYFRPRTPTQFRNEGIRPVSQRWQGAHCPVPVFFCFDTLDLLTREDTEVSTGNMGSSHVQHGPAGEILRQIPFKHVFHDGRWAPDEADAIKFHRHAEVLVPGSLALHPALRMVACRSAAERTTLLHLLGVPFRARWERLVRLGYDGLFERKWTFVESVGTIGDAVEFRFNPSTLTPGPFQVGFVLQDRSGGAMTWSGQMSALSSAKQFQVKGATRGEATLELDGCTAFCGEVTFDDRPF